MAALVRQHALYDQPEAVSHPNPGTTRHQSPSPSQPTLMRSNRGAPSCLATRRDCRDDHVRQHLTRLSFKPDSTSWRLFGNQTVPPDRALVPPTFSAFSSSPTFAPAAAAPHGRRQTGRAGAEHDDVLCLVLHRGLLLVGSNFLRISGTSSASKSGDDRRKFVHVPMRDVDVTDAEGGAAFLEPFADLVDGADQCVRMREKDVRRNTEAACHRRQCRVRVILDGDEVRPELDLEVGEPVTGAFPHPGQLLVRLLA
jgi:hypothetical protein